MIDARSAPIKEVHFPAVLGPSYVYASRPAIRGAVDQFLGFEASGGPRGRAGPGGRDATGTGPAKRDRQTPQQQPEGSADPDPGNPTGWSTPRRAAATSPRPSPARSEPSSRSSIPRRLPSGVRLRRQRGRRQSLRVYHLRDTDGNLHGAYRMVLQIPQGDYFGVQGIRGWTDPPILSDPSETRDDRAAASTTSSSTATGSGWSPGMQGDNSYWVANSLLQTLTNDQMLGIARSIGELEPNPKPKRTPARQSMSEKQPIGVDRGRLGRPGHGRLLRRARPPGRRPRHRRREGRGAAPRARRRSTSPASASCSQRNAERLTFTTEMAELLDGARLLFVCVDTPPTYSGDADLSRVRSVVEELRAGRRPRRW